MHQTHRVAFLFYLVLSLANVYIRSSVGAPISSNNYQVLQERLHSIQEQLLNQTSDLDDVDELSDDAIKHLRTKLTTFLLTQWAVNASILNELPLAILAQLSPASPLSLIGCPSGTVPFDLKTCTQGILAEEDIAGFCPHANTVYSRHLQSCATQAEADPYTLCPEEFRITLPPMDAIKGPCQSQQVIRAIPTCDPPYRLVLDEGVCIKDSASIGFIGCRPGELRKGKSCFVAFQKLLQVNCSRGFEGRVKEDGVPECFHDEIVSGGWNIWTQRAICPPNFKATVQRYAPMELNSIGNDPDYSHPKSHPNVTCTATFFRSPLSVECPKGGIPYNEYIVRHQNLPPVQFNGKLGDPKGTCVLVRDFPIGPACPKTNQRVFVEGKKFIVDQASVLSTNRQRKAMEKERVTMEKELLDRNQYEIVRELQKEKTMDDWNVFGQSEKRKLGRRREVRRERKSSESIHGNIIENLVISSSIENPLMYYPLLIKSSNNRMEFIKESDDHSINPLLQFPSSLQTTMIPKSITTLTTTTTTIAEIPISITTSMTIQSDNAKSINPSLSNVSMWNVFSLPSPGTPVIDVNWDMVILADELVTELNTRLNINASDIDWITAVLHKNIRVICQSSEKAQFYLSCPETFKLRKDGSCRGLGFINFQVICPEGFALDQLSLSTSKYRFPKARCIGQIPTATQYYCPEFKDQQEVIANSQQIKNQTMLEAWNRIGNQTSHLRYQKLAKQFPFLEGRYFEGLLMLKFLTDSFSSAAERGGTSKVYIDGFPIGVSKLNDLLNHYDQFYSQKKQNTPWTLLRDYPKLDRLVIMGTKNMEGISFSLRSNGSSSGKTGSSPATLSFPSVNSHSVKDLDRDYLRLILTTMSPLKVFSQLDANGKRTEDELRREPNNDGDFMVNTKTEIIKDEVTKRCYTVKRCPAFFTPTEDMVIGLYGDTFGGELLNRVNRGEKAGGSPFYPLLPKLRSEVQHHEEFSMTVEEMQAYTKLQRAPRFGPPPFEKLRQSEIPIAPTQP